MAFTHTFLGVTPPPRTDGFPWASIFVEESIAATGPFVLIANLPLLVDLTPRTPDPVDVTVTTATIERGYFRFSFTAAGSTSPWTREVYSPSIPYGSLDVTVLKAEYLDITGIKHDAFIGRMLASTYAFALSYTGRGAAAPLPPELEDAIYTHAARNFRERDALYADQVVLSEDGGVVNYFRSLPPRVKAVYEMHRVSKRKTLTSVPLVRGLS